MIGRAMMAAALGIACLCAARAEPLPPARTLLLVLVPGLSLPEARQIGAGAAAIGVMPTRSDGTDDLAAYRVLATGTRSPAVNGEDLGGTLRASGVRTVAVGGNGARVLAGESSRVEPAGRMRRAEAPFGWATDPEALAGAVRRAGNARSLFAAVLFDDLARADAYAPRCLPGATQEQRQDALRRLGRLLVLLRKRNAADVLLVAPEPSAAAQARRERLGPVLLWRGAGNDGGAALLTSPSTRETPGLVANTDVAATVADLLGIPGQIGAGRPMETRPAPGEEPPFRYLTGRVAAWAAQAREQRLLVGVPWTLAGALLAMTVAAGAPRAAPLALWAASAPLALLLAAPLAPEAEGFAWGVYAIAFALSLAPPLLGRALAPRAVFTGVCAATALAVALDGLLGFPLLGRSPFSYSPIEAARFYGIGNEASGAFLGASLVAAAAWGRPGAAGAAGALVAGIFGHPRLGADFGGLTAAAVGFAALVLALRGRRASRKEVAAAAVLALIFVGGLVAWEASRGAGSQTHIGRAVAAARERGAAALGEIALRKAALGARLLFTSPWAALFWTEVATGAWLLRRRGAPPGGALTLAPPDRRDAAALGGLALGGGAALLVNDSGVVAAAACLLYGAPLRILSLSTTGSR